MLLGKSRSLVYRLLMWIGFNSLLLFPVHLEIKHYLGKIYNHFGISNWLLLFITILVLSIPICNFITNYMPCILGQGNKNKQ